MSYRGRFTCTRSNASDGKNALFPVHVFYGVILKTKSACTYFEMHTLDRFHEAVPVHSVALDFGIRLRDGEIAYLNVCKIGVIFNKRLGDMQKNLKTN